MKRFFFFGFLLLLLCAFAQAETTRSIAILLDISKSIPQKDFQKAKETILELVQKAPPGDSISLYAFGNELRKVELSELSKIQASESYTMLYDAAYDVSQDLAKQSASRKAILVISDGYDTKSATILEDIVSFANNNGIAIYGIGLGKVNRKALERIAKLTGGEFFDLRGKNLIGGVQSAVASQKEVAAKEKPARAVPVARLTPPAVAAPVVPQPPEARKGFSLLWVVVIVGGALLALLAAFVAIRVLRPEPRTCPTCGRRLEPYQTICPQCSGARTVVSKKPVAASDGTQEIQTSMEEEIPERIPVELLEKKPVTEEMLSKTFVLMETPMLVVRKGKNLGQSFSLNRAFPVSIGRSRVNEIPVDDVTVSGQHCRIIPENGKHVLYDLGSTNGTFINDKKVTRAILHEGDIIKVGETQFLYKIEQHRT